MIFNIKEIEEQFLHDLSLIPMGEVYFWNQNINKLRYISKVQFIDEFYNLTIQGMKIIPNECLSNILYEKYIIDVIVFLPKDKNIELRTDMLFLSTLGKLIDGICYFIIKGKLF